MTALAKYGTLSACGPSSWQVVKELLACASPASASSHWLPPFRLFAFSPCSCLITAHLPASGAALFQSTGFLAATAAGSNTLALLPPKAPVLMSLNVPSTLISSSIVSKRKVTDDDRLHKYGVERIISSHDTNVKQLMQL